MEMMAHLDDVVLAAIALEAEKRITSGDWPSYFECRGWRVSVVAQVDVRQDYAWARISCSRGSHTAGTYQEGHVLVHLDDGTCSEALVGALKVFRAGRLTPRGVNGLIPALALRNEAA